MIGRAQIPKVFWESSPFSQHCLTCLFTWIHNDYCIRKNFGPLEAYRTENLFGIYSVYTSWKLVWSFTRRIECWVSYLFSWIEIIQNWSALIVFLPFEFWYFWNLKVFGIYITKHSLTFTLRKTLAHFCRQCSVLRQAGNEGSGAFPFASHNQQ